MPSTDNNFSWWSAFRTFCLLTGPTLIGMAYFAPEQLEPYMSTDLAWTVGFILLLLLPISMVIRFGSKRFFGTIRKSGRRAAIERAREGMPEWAEARGLSFEPSPQHGEVGEVMGEYRGFKLLYAPDAGDISVQWRQSPYGELDVSTTPPPAVSPDESEPFDTDHERFNVIFQTRFASPELAERVQTSTEIRDALTEFWDSHEGELEELHVDAHGMVCFLDADIEYDLDGVGELVDEQLALMESLQKHFE
jgi:hypothetical protein